MRLRVTYNRRADAPVFITTSPLPSGMVAVAYSLQMLATRGALPFTWMLFGQTGTNGWNLSPTGLLTVTPVNAETDALTIAVQSKDGQIIIGVFSITVNTNLGNIVTDAPAGGGSQISDQPGGGGNIIID